MKATKAPKISWFLSTLALIIAALPMSAVAAGTTSIDGGSGDDAVIGLNADNRENAVVCSVLHQSYGAMGGEMRFGLDSGNQSAVISGPTAMLFKVEVKPVSGETPSALVTVRGELNGLRFLDPRSSFVERHNGLEGFGTKEISGADQINFNLVTSTGNPGLITVGCRIDIPTRQPAQASSQVVVQGAVRAVDFTHVDD